MQRLPRVKFAALEADSAIQLIETHRDEFAGTLWMPANFFQRKRVVYILQRMQELYEDFEGVNFKDIPGEAQLEKSRYRMWLSLRQAKRWQVKDHMRFLQSVNDMMTEARKVYERLRRLALTGQIVRSSPTDYQPSTPTRLD